MCRGFVYTTVPSTGHGARQLIIIINLAIYTNKGMRAQATAFITQNGPFVPENAMGKQSQTDRVGGIVGGYFICFLGSAAPGLPCQVYTIVSAKHFVHR